VPNAWDVPDLDPALAATELALPVTKWGTRRRSDPMPGTWHFYTHDYKYLHLWRCPRLLTATGCRVVVEPNYSTYPEMSRAEALWGVFRKRVLARHWQLAGVRTVVDLDVEPRFRDLALLGVPDGWPSYATRVHRGMGLDVIEEDFDLACRHARGAPALFAVFGGGRKVKRACLRRGWEWCAEHRQVVQGIEAPYGQG
jgi:hypothetical protein